MFGWASAAEQSGHAATSVGYQGVKFPLFLEEQGRVKSSPCSARAAASQSALQDLVKAELKTITTKKTPNHNPRAVRSSSCSPEQNQHPQCGPQRAAAEPVQCEKNGWGGFGASAISKLAVYGPPPLSAHYTPGLSSILAQWRTPVDAQVADVPQIGTNCIPSELQMNTGAGRREGALLQVVSSIPGDGSSAWAQLYLPDNFFHLHNKIKPNNLCPKDVFGYGD